jgi:[acyl-carrier-protein] S-malonyltransferase
MAPDPKHTAFVFPGQGSQLVGMGKALADSFPEAARLFAEADAVLGFPLTRLCWEGPEEELCETFNTQPALLTHSVAAWKVFAAEAGGFRPVCVAGHSLGEFSALVAAGALAFPDALRLTRERGRVMRAAGAARPAGMAAILNLAEPELEAVCREASAETGGVVSVANDNCPGQVVISGEAAALERAMALALRRGARRAVRLAVSIGSHSVLMREAAEEFGAAVDAAQWSDPEVPVISNIDARPVSTAAGLRADVKAQLVSPVRWVDSVRAMQALGADTFLEFGSKDVLTGLLRRIDPQLRGFAVGGPAEIRSVMGV